MYHRLEQMLDEPKVDSETYNVFKSVDTLFDDNVYKIKTPTVPDLITTTEKKGLASEKSVTEKSKKEKSYTATELINKSNENLEAAGYKIAKNFKDYYKYKVSATEEGEIPNLLPYTLSLTILGIASIQVGDTFKVDYLPNRYQESTYLQTIKVSHEIGPVGWYTTLDTQFRLLPEMTDTFANSLDKSKIRLSPAALQSIGFEDKIQVDAGKSSVGNPLAIADLAPLMTNIEIKYDRTWEYDFELDFIIGSDLTGEIEDESGYVKNLRGNFYVEFSDEDKRDAALLTEGQDFSDNYQGTFSSPGLSYYYSGNKVWPPDVQLVKKRAYTMLVWGDKIAILEKTNKYYEKQKSFFRTYLGGHRPDEVINVREELQGVSVCFVKGTKISMADDSEKNIEDISIGDEVKSWNEVTNKYENNFVTKTYKHKVNESLLMLNNLIKTTTNHPFYSNNQWVDAGDLKVGSEIVHISGEKHKIKNIQSIDNVKMVYNFEVENTHTYFAENYLVHNK